MKAIKTNLPGVMLLEPRVFRDGRGFFLESYNRRQFSQAGIHADWVQDNHSRSEGGVLRGLHYQLNRPQAKLVRVVRGEIYDVVVDVRRNSNTLGQWVGQVLSEGNQRILFVPRGFAHGFYVMSGIADVHYKCDDFYTPEEERGLRWDDPSLKIDWPISSGGDPFLSERDAAFPLLAECGPQDLIPAELAFPQAE